MIADAHSILVDSDDDVPLKSLNQKSIRRRRPTGMTRQKEAGLAKLKKNLWMRKLKDKLTDACSDEVVADTNPRKRRLILDDGHSGEEDEIAVPMSSPAPYPKRWKTVLESETRKEKEETKNDASAASLSSTAAARLRTTNDSLAKEVDAPNAAFAYANDSTTADDVQVSIDESTSATA
jgi:hypothetical protein